VIQKWKKPLVAGLTALILGIALTTSVAAEDQGRPVKSRIAPTYPELAKRANLTGAVKLQVTIAPSGVVKSVKVIGGHPLLAESAIDAVKKWKYEAAAEESSGIVEFHFDNNRAVAAF